MLTANATRFINPYTDFGFKKLFGTELNKDLLISFLNALFNNNEKEIEDIQYLNGENLGDGYGDRRSIFDVYCMAKDGSRFIVEMQKAEQTYFKDRSVYYATTPIRQQAPKGKWDYHLDEVYTIGILNFEFPNGEYPADSYRHEVKMKDVDFRFPMDSSSFAQDLNSSSQAILSLLSLPKSSSKSFSSILLMRFTYTPKGFKETSIGTDDGPTNIPWCRNGEGKSQHRADKPCIQHVPVDKNQEIPSGVDYIPPQELQQIDIENTGISVRFCIFAQSKRQRGYPEFKSCFWNKRVKMNK
ncbi:MAG: Rpn family recombination-promoting nuclease/putative transposase [Bacteroidales bacterium]|nr:Rpn family recombination-promoting nuclease/putative transposase [Bacteroidales bacterium]